MNWGGFAGGFSQGIGNGMQIGKAYNDANKEYKLNQVREQGIAEATAARDAEVEKSIKDNGTPDTKATQATQATAPSDATAAPADQTAAPAAPAPQLAANPATAEPQDQNRMIPQELQGSPAAAPVAPAAAPAASEMPNVESPAARGVTGNKRYTVGDKSFDTIEDARAHAQKNKPSVMDFMGKTLVPKMQEAYIAQGDVEKAEAWGKWSKERDSQKYMETWGKAFQAAQAGDFDTAADHVAKLHSDFDDGHTVVSREKIKDANGNVTGISLTTKDDKTGEKTTQVIDPKKLVELGLGGLSPEKRFELAYKNKTAADAMGAKAAIDAQNDARTANRQEASDIRKDARQEQIDIRRGKREAQNADTQHGYKLEEMATKEDLEAAGVKGKERAKVQSKIDILRENGMSPETIKELIPHMVGGDGYKKSTSPEEARRLLLTERVKDPLFSRKSQAEQNAQIDKDMQTVYGAPKPAAPAAPAAAAAAVPASPAAGGIPGAKPKGTPYMTPDGKIVYR